MYQWAKLIAQAICTHTNRVFHSIFSALQQAKTDDDNCLKLKT